jgi:hypothetical protein
LKIVIELEIDYEEYYELGSEKVLSILENQLLSSEVFIDLKEIHISENEY